MKKLKKSKTFETLKLGACCQPIGMSMIDNDVQWMHYGASANKRAMVVHPRLEGRLVSLDEKVARDNPIF